MVMSRLYGILITSSMFDADESGKFIVRTEYLNDECFFCFSLGVLLLHLHGIFNERVGERNFYL